MKAPTRTELENQFVRLVPLAQEHAAAFSVIGKDPTIWRYLAPEPFRNTEDAERWIKTMLGRPEYAVSYSVFDTATNSLAGSTSYMSVSQTNESLEIGFTWYAKQFQRTSINTATKLVLLTNAFENLGAGRVQLQTDARNTASQAAIARIGGVREGVLRNHKKYPNGFVRDTVVFSIIRNEWPGIRQKLTDRLRA